MVDPRRRTDISRRAIGLAICLTLAACSTFQNYEGPETPRYSGAYAPSLPPADGTIKVVSYNIKFGIKTDQAIADLTQIPELADADLLLLQEMDSSGANRIASRLRDNYVYYPASIEPATKRDFGNAVLSRWPIRRTQKVLLPHARPFRGERRIAAFAEIQVGRFRVLACSAHTETMWLGRRGRADQLAAVIESLPREARCVVVGGDLNTVNLEAVRAAERAFGRAGFEAVSRGIGPTVRGEPTGLVAPQSDHIFVRGMTVIARGKARSARASDHFPIWVRLRLEPTTS
jgi:endonuclease/exonuclease/phosphatase family metal-dependent hydrolase